VNGVKTDPTAPNTLNLSVAAHTFVQGVFYRTITVSSFNDSGSGTLREALSNAEDGDIITFSGVTPGTTVIELQSYLPSIRKNLTIEGNGVTLTSKTGSYFQQLYISNAVVTIRRVHFKDSRGLDVYAGAVYNTEGGTLILESCIFSGNQQAAAMDGKGGAVGSVQGDLVIRGCTFYLNTARYGGAIFFSAAEGKTNTLTLTGNLFYGNTAGDGYPVLVYNYYHGGGIVAPSYNVVDVALGPASNQCGWTAGTGDITFAAKGITGVPFNTTTFVPVSGVGSILPSGLPADFPATDFYGNARTSRAPGAVDHAP
jgi:hypothetical protein